MPLGDNNTDIYILIDHQGYSNHAKSEIQISICGLLINHWGRAYTEAAAAAHGMGLILVNLYKYLLE